MFKPDKTYIFALGGLGEIGKNMYCVMHGNEIIVIDSGVIFPEEELRGIDYVLPDFSFLEKNEKKIKALIITHGHEDHIGAIPFLLQSVNIPFLYAPNQACGLIRKKLEERNIQYKGLKAYNSETKLKYQNFEIGFIPTTHSIPDSHGIIIKTPDGTIFETGDFKFDFTPIGPMADIHKMAALGTEGVTLLLSDSTNALDEGFSMSESKVDIALGDVFANHKENRLIIATFASNIYRLKHIVETCKKNNRKICIFGRSMENNINISIEGGYITNKDIFVTADVANQMKPKDVVLLCTGSQGEPLAALSRIADGTHRQIKLRPDDVVVFSSSAIPGNANSIANTINNLYLKGVKVYTNTSLSDIHTSGHGKKEELKLMLRLIKPKYFMPMHGEHRMLKAHANLAMECDIPKENVFILDNGDILCIDHGKITKDGSMDVSEIYVDGSRIGNISGAVLNDRKIMASDGILVIIANLNLTERKLLIKPNITTRGFVLINENEELLTQIEKLASYRLINALNNKEMTFNDIRLDLQKEVTTFIRNKTGRRPLVLPIILDIKK